MLKQLIRALLILSPYASSSMIHHDWTKTGNLTNFMWSLHLSIKKKLKSRLYFSFSAFRIWPHTVTTDKESYMPTVYTKLIYLFYYWSKFIIIPTLTGDILPWSHPSTCTNNLLWVNHGWHTTGCYMLFTYYLHNVPRKSIMGISRPASL